MTDKETTYFITNVLYEKYAKIENIFAYKELQVQNPEQLWKRIDLYIIHAFPSKQFHAKAFEVKVSRSDFKNDFKKENKQDLAIKYSNEFYYVTPPKLIKKDEIPEYAGLIEVDNAGKCKIIKKAPKREKAECNWYFYIMTLRNKTKQEIEEQRVLKFDMGNKQALNNKIHNKDREIKQLQMIVEQYKHIIKTITPLVKDNDLPIDVKPIIDMYNT